MSLEFKNIVKRVDSETHIYATDLKIEDGGFNILLGTTLSGKTTLLHLMAGLDKPTSGELWFNGKNVTGVPAQKRNVSMVHQQFINYPNFTVFENIASPLRISRMPSPEINSRVQKVSELLKLTPLLQRNPSELSGGQQQRTALARALVKDADLVLLDEPLANLDFKLREELRDELPRIFGDRHCTVVYATSEPSEALLLGGHTATLHEGRVTQFGETSKIYRHPKDLQSAKVFSDPPINSAKIEKQGGTFTLNEAISWPVLEKHNTMRDGTYTVGIRPHHISTLAGSENMTSIKGKVVTTEFSGSESTVHFGVGDQTWVSQSRGIHPIEIGATTDFYLDISRCLYFDTNNELVSL
ncbi:MAG: ABC transporter ATP-binding protein [Alphaproteobacteria bacterium]|nr:ABC transporter ATP-binding protein [Rhodospirillales bacterium]MCW9046403.1 ABC transporter ATP-binding protein [Alphaproteobacteria bacterium]